LLVALAFASLVGPVVLAQSQPLSTPEAFLDKMTGDWVMTGTISKKPATHDVDVDWVLKARVHPHPRTRSRQGRQWRHRHEAWVYIIWDAKKGEYAVMWLDNTAATNFAAEGIGHAKPDGDRIPFIFKDAEGTGIHTTFAYDRAKDTWSWTIDNLDKFGKSSSFAKLTLTRRK
jgi:hypothetical protein